MIGTNFAEQAASNDMDKLLTLMSVVNDPDRVNKALTDLKQSKIEADEALYALELGKAAAVALAEAHTMKAGLEKKIAETNAAVDGVLSTARTQAAVIKAAAEVLNSQAFSASELAKQKLIEAETALANAKNAKERADDSRQAADEALATANETQARLNNRLSEINAKIAAL